MNILENISLQKFNTFGIDIKAAKYVSIRNDDDLRRLDDEGIFNSSKFLILGNGSNILFTDDFDGFIVHSQFKGMRILDSNDDSVILDVAAGEEWDNLVSICLKNNYYGLENLALIPGTVGAAAVQNIGAYGAEQKDYFHSLRGFDLEQNKFVEYNFDDCNYGYRSSIFKSKLKGKFIVTSVRYKLSKKFTANLKYQDLKQEIDKFGIEEVDAQYIYDTVCRLRRKKLPDPMVYGNAGSFFKNPVVEKSFYEQLKRKYTKIKGYVQSDETVKLSAAWLIEKAGWKGKRFGDAGVCDKHALILINYGNASGSDIFDLSEKIRQSVNELFGVNLEPEVLIVKST